jgi:hypothetical protein
VEYCSYYLPLHNKEMVTSHSSTLCLYVKLFSGSSNEFCLIAVGDFGWIGIGISIGLDANK